MKHILSYMRRAIEDYDMIEDGDKIAVALSGKGFYYFVKWAKKLTVLLSQEI